LAENKNKLMMIIIIVLLAILLIAIAAISVVAFRVFSGESDEAAVESHPPVISLTPAEITVIDLTSPIRTNLAVGAGGSSHFISVDLSIGINTTAKKNSDEFIALVASREAIIRDVILGIIKSKTFEELSRPDGQDMLKDEILSKLQSTFRNNLLVAIYMNDWALQ
jgi:flagellar FliL protein